MSFKQLRSVDYIVVHCAATRPSLDIGAQEIRRWHMQKGWFDIGYHKVIRRDGKIEVGRESTVPGAHARGFNERSLSVCLVGGVAEDGKTVEDNFTDEQYASLWFVLLNWKSKYPDAEIVGHRDLPGVNKGCPSFDVRAWLDGRPTLSPPIAATKHSRGEPYETGRDRPEPSS